MIFQGIAPKIRDTDPRFFRFELSLHWQYIAFRIMEFNESIRKAMVNFGVSIKMAAESMKRITLLLNQNK